jgi:hypothetical protein
MLTKKDVLDFKEAAKKYVEENTVSKEAAIKALIRIGVLTPDGEKSKNYYPEADNSGREK